MILYVERCDRRSGGSPGWRSPLEDDTQATSVYVCTRYTVYDQTDGRMRAEEGPPGLSRQRKKITCALRISSGSDPSSLPFALLCPATLLFLLFPRHPFFPSYSSRVR